MSSNTLKLKLFFLAVGLASSSTITLEIMLTRVFSVTMYYHFAFMVSLLGLALMVGISSYVVRAALARRAQSLQRGRQAA